MIENLKVKKKSLHLSIRGKIVTFHSSYRHVDLVTFTLLLHIYQVHCTVNMDGVSSETPLRKIEIQDWKNKSCDNISHPMHHMDAI